MPERTARDTIKTHDAIPRAAVVLGAAGLIPFLACALQIATAWPLERRMIGPALHALTIYGAVILSFMGGVQWGLATAQPPAANQAEWRRYGMSVLPAMVAWAGVWTARQSGLILLAGGFALLLAYDLWTVARGEAPAWYGRLRIGLTAIALACLLAAAILGPF